MSFIGSLEHMDFIKSEAEYGAMSNRELQDLYDGWTEWLGQLENLDEAAPPEYYAVLTLLERRRSAVWEKYGLSDDNP